MHANIAGGDNLRPGRGDVRELARAQRIGQFRLQQIVRPSRAAAQMPLGNVADRETRRREERPGLGMDALAVLHGTRGMIGDAHAV